MNYIILVHGIPAIALCWAGPLGSILLLGLAARDTKVRQQPFEQKAPLPTNSKSMVGGLSFSATDAAFLQRRTGREDENPNAAACRSGKG